MNNNVRLISVKSAAAADKQLSIVSSRRKIGAVQYVDFGESLSIRDIRILKAKDARKGFGTASVRGLFELFPDARYITGRSLPESKVFWLKVGATFVDGNKFVLNRGNL